MTTITSDRVENVYRAFRLNHGVRDSIKFTADFLNISKKEVCKQLGFDLKFAVENK